MEDTTDINKKTYLFLKRIDCSKENINEIETFLINEFNLIRTDFDDLRNKQTFADAGFVDGKMQSYFIIYLLYDLFIYLHDEKKINSLIRNQNLSDVFSFGANIFLNICLGGEKDAEMIYKIFRHVEDNKNYQLNYRRQLLDPFINHDGSVGIPFRYEYEKSVVEKDPNSWTNNYCIFKLNELAINFYPLVDNMNEESLLSVCSDTHYINPFETISKASFRNYDSNSLAITVSNWKEKCSLLCDLFIDNKGKMNGKKIDVDILYSFFIYSFYRNEIECFKHIYYSLRELKVDDLFDQNISINFSRNLELISQLHSSFNFHHLFQFIYKASSGYLELYGLLRLKNIAYLLKLLIVQFNSVSYESIIEINSVEFIYNWKNNSY
jgi:hypothetical protein